MVLFASLLERRGPHSVTLNKSVIQTLPSLPLSPSFFPLSLTHSLTHKPEPFSTHQKGLTAFVWALPLGSGALCTPACGCQRTTIEKRTEPNENQTSSVAMFPGFLPPVFDYLQYAKKTTTKNKRQGRPGNYTTLYRRLGNFHHKIFFTSCLGGEN